MDALGLFRSLLLDLQVRQALQTLLLVRPRLGKRNTHDTVKSDYALTTSKRAPTETSQNLIFSCWRYRYTQPEKLALTKCQVSVFQQGAIGGDEDDGRMG